MSAEVLESIGDDPEFIEDFGVWVDNVLRGIGGVVPQPIHTNRPEDMWFTSARSANEPDAGLEMGRSVLIPDRERRNMSQAEIEQCSLADNLWGMDTFKAHHQEKSLAEIEAEDRRSQAVLEKIKNEELHAFWDEGLRTREMRSAVKARLVVNVLRASAAALPQPVHTNRPEDICFTSAGSVDEPATELEMGRRVSIANRERHNMRLAEIEQCSLLDTFWGIATFTAQQEKASAEMEAEDRRSQAVRDKIKKEELHAFWDEEELRTKEMRSAAKARLEHAARLEYLETFYRAPSAELVIDYRWPTRPDLPQPLGQRSPTRNGNGEATTRESKLSTDGQLPPKTVHAGGATPAMSAMHFDAQCPSHSTSGLTLTISSGARESASARPFHTFRGKKAHSLLSMQDSFVPPRRLDEPVTKVVFASAGGASGARSPARRASLGRPAHAGLIKAVPLPPLADAPIRDGPTPWNLPGLNDVPETRGQNAGGSNRPKVLKPGAPGQPLLPSFDHKFSAWCAARARETGLVEAKEQRKRVGGLILGRRRLGVRGGRGGRGEGDGHCSSAGRRGIQLSGRGGHRGVDESRSARRRPWCDSRGHDSYDGQKAINLIPEREEELLSRIFGMVDTRGRGEVRLDEVMFHMTENAQVKILLKQVTLWAMVKTRRWQWLEDLFAAQASRTLTLSALLDYSRSLREGRGIPRKHVRLPEALRVEDGIRRDARSKRLLPTELTAGQEVESLFMKGFQWYRAWIVRSHPYDDTFDVRFTQPLSTSESGASRETRMDHLPEELHPDVETPSTTFFGSTGENSCDITEEEDATEAAEEEWRETCENVTRFIGIPPDLGMTERDVLEGAFDAIVSLTTAAKALGSAREQRHDAPANALGGGGSRVVAANENDPGNKHASEDPANPFPSTEPGNESSREARGWRRARGEPDQFEGRVPASEILRLLRAGAIEDYRRVSPALTATCMYREFAQGLGEAAYDGGIGSRGEWEGRVEENARDRELKRVVVDRGLYLASAAERDGGGRGEASDLGLTKAEFCEFFEAVTDLVDLNGLSLVRNRPS